MLGALGYKSKKQLKESIGKSLRYQETSLHGNEYTDNGKVTMVGPSAYDRKWYAVVTLVDGKITKVS